MFTPSNAFIFAPMFNQPPDGANPNGNDATGAFQPGAQMFANFCTSNGTSVTSILFNNHASGDQRRNEILHNMAIAPAQIDTTAYSGGSRVAPADNISGWVTALNDPTNDLWIRFPFMTDDEISAELS